MNSSSKRGLRAAIVVAVLVAVGSGVWLTTFRRDDRRELQAATAAFMARVAGGKASEAYAQAADELRANVDHGVFQLAADDLVGAAGKYVAVKGNVTAEVTRAGDAQKADVVATVAFEKRELPVHLGFVRRDGWRVSSFDLVYPDKMWPAPDPEALLKESATWMEWFHQGDLGSMYERFYPDVWSGWKPSAFEADINKLRGDCYGMALQPPTVVGTNDEGHTLVEAKYTCQDGQVMSTRLRWQWLRGKWRLLKVSWVKPGAGTAAH